MSPMNGLLAVLVSCLLVGTAAPALAQSEEPAGEPTGEPAEMIGPREEGPKHVQLTSFMAPVLLPGRKRTVHTAITVILKIDDEKKVGAVCRVTPRIRDAMMQTLYETPIPSHDGRTVDLEGVDQQLLMAVNHALDQDLVSEVFVMKGAVDMGSGAITLLPFSSSGCKELKGKKKSTSTGE